MEQRNHTLEEKIFNNGFFVYILVSFSFEYYSLGVVRGWKILKVHTELIGKL